MINFRIGRRNSWNKTQNNDRSLDETNRYQTRTSSSYERSHSLRTQVNTSYLPEENERFSSHANREQEWLEELDNQILQNIDKINFTIDDLANYMNISTRQIYRLIQNRLGQTPHQYLKNYRLNHARTLLEERQVDTVKAAAYSTGFPNVVYFSRQFRQAFGYLPSELL